MDKSSLKKLKAAAAQLKGTWFSRLSRSVMGLGLELACAISSGAFAAGAIAFTVTGPRLAIEIYELPAAGNDWSALVNVDTNIAIGLGVLVSTLLAGSFLLAGFGGYLAGVRRERRLVMDLCDGIEKLPDPEDKELP